MKKFFIPIAISIGIITLLFFTLRKTNNDDTFFIKINNENINIVEYILYLSEQKYIFETVGGKDIWETAFDNETAENSAKQAAVTQMTRVKVSLQKANTITLNEEENLNAENKAETYFNSLDSTFKENFGINQDTADKFTKETQLFGKIYTETTKNFIASEADFEIYFKDYLGKNPQFIEDMSYEYIILEDPDILPSNENFFKNKNDLIVEKLSESNFSDEIKTYIKTLKLGETSNIISTGKNKILINITEIFYGNLSEVKTSQINSYNKKKKDEIFNEEFGTDVANAQIDINVETLNSISIEDIIIP